MKKLRKQLTDDEPASEGAPGWLQTYSDMVTLVLTFFVLLFSMSTISKEKFEQLSSSLSAAFMGTGRGGVYGYNDGTVLYSVKENTTGDILEDGEEAFATSVGALLGFDIRLVLMFVAVWLVTFLPTRWVSLGSILGIWSVFIFAFAILPFFPWALLFLAFFITWRHKDNIRRLMAGSENKTFLPWEQKKAAAGNS